MTVPNLVQPWPLARDDEPFASVQRCCDRIDEVDALVRASVTEPDRRARLRVTRESRAADWSDRTQRPPLHGVPVGVKDIVRVDGLPTRAGSALPPEVLAGPQAAVVDRLERAGAVVAGKTVTAEFASIAPGPTANPHNLAHTPGGSSSGSAAAIAAGMVPLAVGTQTIGSIIRPAAYCGVVGFKPTHGRIPMDGVIPHALTLDTVGFLAADVASITLAARVCCDRWQPGGSANRAPILGIPVGPYLHRAGAETLAVFDRQVMLLRAAGFTVGQVPIMADFERIVARQKVINYYELAGTHAGWFARFEHLYREQTASKIRHGQTIVEPDYLHALADRTEFQRQLVDAMTDAGIDLWIAPATTGVAPRGLDSTGDSIMCLPWSFAGLPALTVPVVTADGELPLGLQCVGQAEFDESLLNWAVDIQAATGAGTLASNR